MERVCGKMGMGRNIKQRKMIKINKEISIIHLFVTMQCNLNCKYCYLKKANKDMSVETAKNAVLLLAHSPGEKKEINFIGGEPLLKFQMIKKIVAFAESLEKDFQFTITTNATLITEEISDFLSSKKFKVIVSLDGAKEVQDSVRKTVDGGSSFDMVSKGLNIIGKAGITPIIKMTVWPEEAKNLFKNFLYLVSQKNMDVNINPAVLVNWAPQEIEDYISEAVKCSKFVKEQNLGIKLNLLEKTKGSSICPFYHKTNIFLNGDIVFCALFLKFNILPQRFIIGNVNSGIKKKYSVCNFDDNQKICKLCFSEYYCNRFCYKYNVKNQRVISCELNTYVAEKLGL